jgi:hypothetical protein
VAVPTLRTRHMLIRRNSRWCACINAYFTRTAWQSTLRPFLGCRTPVWFA